MSIPHNPKRINMSSDMISVVQAQLRKAGGRESSKKKKARRRLPNAMHRNPDCQVQNGTRKHTCRKNFVDELKSARSRPRHGDLLRPGNTWTELIQLLSSNLTSSLTEPRPSTISSQVRRHPATLPADPQSRRNQSSILFITKKNFAARALHSKKSPTTILPASLATK